MQQFTIPSSLDRARVDETLHVLDPAISRRAARTLADLGGVAAGGVRRSASARVRAGSSLAFCKEYISISLELGLPVFFENNDLLIISKPPGLAVHGGPLIKDSVVARLRKLGAGSGLVSRLDREASGLLMIGKNAPSLREYAAQTESGLIQKEYWAIASGTIKTDSLTIDFPLRVLDEPMGNLPKTIVDYENGDPALTNVKVVARVKDFTFVSVRIATGRTHQIRAHLAAAGFPLVGDARYGNPEVNRIARETYGAARTMLHCRKLEFRGMPPETSQELTAEITTITAWTEPDFDRIAPQN
ncbi:MAG: RluA family pseudouridine synthase [Planctomycetota bacterium]